MLQMKLSNTTWLPPPATMLKCSSDINARCHLSAGYKKNCNTKDFEHRTFIYNGVFLQCRIATFTWVKDLNISSTTHYQWQYMTINQSVKTTAPSLESFKVLEPKPKCLKIAYLVWQAAKNLKSFKLFIKIRDSKW